MAEHSRRLRAAFVLVLACVSFLPAATAVAEFDLGDLLDSTRADRSPSPGLAVEGRLELPDGPRLPEVTVRLALPPLTRVESARIFPLDPMYVGRDPDHDGGPPLPDGPETRTRRQELLRLARTCPESEPAFPPGSGRLVSTGWQGGIRVARMLVHPQRYLPRSGALESTRRFRVELDAVPLDRAGRKTLPPLPAAAPTEPFDVVNPDQAREWYDWRTVDLSRLFGGDLPPDFAPDELGRLPIPFDVLVVAHMGGWGHVPLEQTEDLRPIVFGIEEYLRSRGLRGLRFCYDRTGGGTVAGKLAVLAELVGLHETGAARFARQLEQTLRDRPHLRAVMVGLSNGAAFGNSTAEQLEDWALERVSSVEVGTPFVRPVFSDPAVLSLINEERDPLPAGDIAALLGNVVSAWWEQFQARRAGRELHFHDALHFTGHEYTWDVIGPVVAGFLDQRLGLSCSPDRAPIPDFGYPEPVAPTPKGGDLE